MHALATQFVALVMKYREWSKVKGLCPDEEQVFLNLVQAAGFEAAGIAPGTLRGHYRDQDGSATGETFVINQMCPYFIIGAQDEKHYRATGWLDCALRKVVIWNGSRQEYLATTVQAIVNEIERSKPLAPIRLSKEGDFLIEYPPPFQALGGEYFVEHTRDHQQVGSCAGIHQYCNGWMDRRGATAQKDCIVCRVCHQRFLFDKHIKTFGQLREALAKTLEG